MANNNFERSTDSRSEKLATLKILHDELVAKLGKEKVRPSAEGDILEITDKNVLIRIALGETRNRQKPFSFYRYVSTANPDKPKTEMYERKKRPVTPMDADEIKAELAKLSPKESPVTPLVEGPRVPVSTEDIRKSAFRDTTNKLGNLDTLEKMCVSGAVVVIRHLGFEEGHARSKVRIKEGGKRRGYQLALCQNGIHRGCAIARIIELTEYSRHYMIAIMSSKHHTGTSIFLSRNTGKKNWSQTSGLLLGLLLTTSGGGFACV